MSLPSPEHTLRVVDPVAFGDVTLAPSAMTGQSEAQLADAMAAILEKTSPASGAEALRQLREAFPASPLTVRVAAFAAAMRR